MSDRSSGTGTSLVIVEDESFVCPCPFEYSANDTALDGSTTDSLAE